MQDWGHRSIKLCEKGLSDSNDAWCLREYDEDGSQIGKDWRPIDLVDHLNFKINHIKLHQDIEGTWTDFSLLSPSLPESRSYKFDMNQLGSLNGLLEPLDNQEGYSMFGTSLPIDFISITITESTSGLNSIACFVEATDTWLESDVQGHIRFRISLSTQRFEKLLMQVAMPRSEVYFSAFCLSGFYKEGPGGKSVKLLSHNQEVAGDEGLLDCHRIYHVCCFNLSVTTIFNPLVDQ